MYGIEAESLSLLEAVLTGMTVCSVYTCLRALRRIIRHTPAAIAAEDLFFWLGTAFYMFVQIHHTTSGSIRWYFILGVVLGSVFFSCLSKIPGKLRKKIVRKEEREIRRKQLNKQEKKDKIKDNNQ